MPWHRNSRQTLKNNGVGFGSQVRVTRARRRMLAVDVYGACQVRELASRVIGWVQHGNIEDKTMRGFFTAVLVHTTG